MEIGSFLELQFPKGKEYYNQKSGIKRLNTGRAAIWHALRVLACGVIWIPYYQCDSVREFLNLKGVQLKFYHLDKEFNPIDLHQADGEAVLIVNYYGVMSRKRMIELAKKYKDVIVDNCQAFFCAPLEYCINVYSCRKFIGVPDGAYVIGEQAEKFQYMKTVSSDTAVFLLERIEYGCEGRAYASRQTNEHRIDTEDCMEMSILTHTILDGTNYEEIKEKRQENFAIARRFFDGINLIDAAQYYDDETIPMVYPLVVEDDGLLSKLQSAKHFQGHWWSYICDEMPTDTVEYWLSRYMIPITIDQRYGIKELEYIKRVVDK